MARRKKKEEKARIDFQLNETSKKKEFNFADNIRTLKDAMAPSELTVVDYNTLKVGEHFVRNFVMQGYPSYVRVG